MGRGLVVGALVLVAVGVGAFVRPSAASSNREDTMRDQIGQFLNMERTNRGLAALPVDPNLAASAQSWSEHNRDTHCESNCHSSHSEGEILAWGDYRSRSGALAVAWMQSTSHRNILLYPDATAMGVGVACQDGGEVYATVQYTGVFQPLPSTEQDPIVSSQDWGSPCSGVEGPMPTTTTTTTPARVQAASTDSPSSTSTTAAAAAHPTSTTQPRPATRPAAPATVTRSSAQPPTTPAPTTTTSTTATPTTTTSTTSPRVALRSDGTGITADPQLARERAEFYASSAATPFNAEPAWVAIVVVVFLLSGMRIAAQLHQRAEAGGSDDGQNVAGL